MAVDGSILPDRYEEPRLIGRGGMGEIYLARDRMLGRTVAVKVFGGAARRGGRSSRERFRREALTAARLSGGAARRHDLRRRRARGPPVQRSWSTSPGRHPWPSVPGAGRSSPSRALAWLEEAAEALDAAHAHGVVHRDVKPANLLFDASDRLQVVDFGIARLMDDTLGMTAPGTILGTAGYLSPEQASGRETTAASDRYALAVVAYELLTGARPFERTSETAEAAAHIHEPVPPASERGAGLPGPPSTWSSPRRSRRARCTAIQPRALSSRGPCRCPPQLVPRLRRRAPTRTRKRPIAPFAVAGALLLALGGVAAALVTRGDGDPTRAAGPELQTVTQQVTVARQPTTVVQTITVAPPETPGPSGPLDVEEAAALNDQAFALMQDGRWRDALPLLERAVPALRGTYSGDFGYEAYAEYNLGRTQAELGDCKEARKHLKRSEAPPGRAGGDRRRDVRSAASPGQKD